MEKLKKKLLIFWGNPYVFYEALAPVLPKLAGHFEISVILIDTFMPKKIPDLMQSLKEKQVLENFWAIPTPRGEWKNLLEHHRVINKLIPEWKKKEFDLFLTGTGTEVLDDYILKCVLPPHCRKVSFLTSLGNILKEDLRSWSGLLRSLRYCFHDLVKNIKYRFVHRILLPWTFQKKVFPLSCRELFLLVPASGMDALLFSDEYEVKAFANEYKNARVELVKYPSQGGCRCGQKAEDKSTILVPLTTGFCSGDQPSSAMLELLHRDLKTVVKQTGAKKLHLRLHPRETAKWPYILRDYLIGKGIKAECVKSEGSYREVMCDYLGMAGMASTSLRDARAACDHAFVIGLLGVSARLGINIRKWFGRAEGIGWINEDGSYDPEIFSRKKFVPSARRDLAEVLCALT